MGIITATTSGPCACCGSVPECCSGASYTFTLSGITNDVCSTCSLWNGTWVLDDISIPGAWCLSGGGIPEMDCFGESGGGMCLTCYETEYLLAFVTGAAPVVSYSRSRADWECCKPMEMTLVTPYSGYCTGWPSTLTVTPNCCCANETFRVTFSGITNSGDCTDCPGYAKEWTMEKSPVGDPPRQWGSSGDIEAGCTTGEMGGASLFCRPGNEQLPPVAENRYVLEMTNSSSVAAYYYCEIAGFVCCGDNTFTFDTAPNLTAVCSGWPTTVTVTGDCSAPMRAGPAVPAQPKEKDCGCGRKVKPLKPGATRR